MDWSSSLVDWSSSFIVSSSSLVDWSSSYAVSSSPVGLFQLCSCTVAPASVMSRKVTVTPSSTPSAPTSGLACTSKCVVSLPRVWLTSLTRTVRRSAIAWSIGLRSSTGR